MSAHTRPAATLVAFGLGCALLATAVLGWPFAMRFSIARPELEAIAQRVLVTRTKEAPVRTQWLQADAAWAVGGAVYVQMGAFIDEWGLVYDPDGLTSWSRNESHAPGWYQWMD